MVKAKVILPFAVLCLVSCAPYKWTQVPMDGSRVGAAIPSTDNVSEALGYIDNGVYTAPNGKTYDGMVADVARIMLDAQPAMAPVKEYLGYADKDMIKDYPESALSNMIVDCVMTATQEAAGRKVDIGLINFGGIRVDIHKGNVIADDILSMLPFKNKLCYVALKGSDVRYMIEKMAATSMQVFGGVAIRVENHRVTSILVNGEPLDDDTVYGLATCDFLLNGGDDVQAARNARELIITEKLVVDAVLPYIRNLTAQGKSISYQTDGRMQIIND